MWIATTPPGFLFPLTERDLDAGRPGDPDRPASAEREAESDTKSNVK